MMYPVVRVTDIGPGSDWTAILQGMDVVIHLAARVHVMRENAENPLEEFRKVNVAGTEHLARSAAASGVKRLAYVSSIKVNGEATCGGDSLERMHLPPKTPMAFQKWRLNKPCIESPQKQVWKW